MVRRPEHLSGVSTGTRPVIARNLRCFDRVAKRPQMSDQLVNAIQRAPIGERLVAPSCVIGGHVNGCVLGLAISTCRRGCLARRHCGLPFVGLLRLNT